MSVPCSPSRLARRLMSALLLLSVFSLGFSASLTAQVVVETTGDPHGDTVQVNGFRHDLIQMRALAEDQHLIVLFDFTQVVEPAGSGAPEELMGYLDIDFDGNAATGFQAYGEAVGLGSVGLGVDGYIDLSSYSSASGTMNLLDLGTNTTTAVAADFSQARVLELRIPLSAIGGHGDVGLSMVVGNAQWEWTDMAPSAGHLLGLGTHQAQFAGKIVVEVDYAHPPSNLAGSGQALERLPSDAFWWFFNPYAPEHWVRVLDGCALTQHWWVMHTGMSNMDVTVTVTHVENGTTKTYQSSGMTAPTLDPYALPCP